MLLGTLSNSLLIYQVILSKGKVKYAIHACTSTIRVDGGFHMLPHPLINHEI